MKDSDGFLPKGWMMHEPYNLHNGTPALALYTYLYRTTRKNAWQGSLQTLSDIVEIPITTVRQNIAKLQVRGLVTLEPLAHSHYRIQAQRLTLENADDDGKCRVDDGRCRRDDGKCREDDGKCQPIKDNINININRNTNHSSSSIKAAPAASAASNEVGLDRKTYIAKVLSRTLPEYPYEVVFEYAAMVKISQDVAAEFVTHYASTGWHMNNGGRVENWAAALMNWNKRAQRFAARDQQKSAAARSITAYQAGQSMSDRNRAIYEEEQKRKKEHREQLDRESREGLTFEEFQALKERLRS